MDSYRFYQADKKDLDELFEVGKKFKRELRDLNLYNIQFIYVMPEHRNFTTFRNLLSGVQKIAKDDPINLSITTKLKLDPVLKKLGFDEMGKNWRLG